MNVLGLDAARGVFSCALVRAGSILSAEQIDGKSALERGMAAVASAIAELHGDRVDRIGVGIGPGSFTGVRIAISYAKSLALAWNVPLVGIDTFEALEEGGTFELPLLSVVRGRTGVISVRLRQPDGAPWRSSGYVNDVLESLPCRPSQLTVLGDAEDVQAGLAERGWAVQRVPEAYCPAAVAVAIASGAREPASSIHAVRADYGELPPAKVPKF